MSGLIGKVGSKSGIIREHAAQEDLVYVNGAHSQTIDSSAEAITSLNRTYTYNAPHYVWCIGGLTMTASGAFHSHVGIFLDGSSMGHPDCHYAPSGEWWYMSWSFISKNVQTAGQHAITFTGDPQLINWNIVGSTTNTHNSQNMVNQG